MRKSGVIIFDGDDTLWWSEELYDHARANAREIVEQAGIDGNLWDSLQRKTDLENVHLMGLSPARFPLSCKQAYEQIAREEGIDPHPIVAKQVHRAARLVFEKKAEVVPNARHVLSSLKDSYVLILLTKGDRQVQEKRIDDSALRDCFHEVSVVNFKKSEYIS